MAREFAEVFASLRAERGLSQRQAAADLGISQALLSHYEKGIRQPRFEFIVRACRYYGVSADYMLGITDSPVNPSTDLLRRADGTGELLLDDRRFRRLLRTIAITAKLLRETYGDGAENAFYHSMATRLFSILRQYERRAGCPIYGEAWPGEEDLLPTLQQLAEARLHSSMPPTAEDTAFPWSQEEAESIRASLAEAEADFRVLRRYFENGTGEEHL